MSKTAIIAVGRSDFDLSLLSEPQEVVVQATDTDTDTDADDDTDAEEEAVDDDDEVAVEEEATVLVD